MRADDIYLENEAADIKSKQMSRVSFDNGNTFKDAQDLSRDDLAKVRNLKHILNEDVITELHRCQSAAKAWCGPFMFNVDDIILKNALNCLNMI